MQEKPWSREIGDARRVVIKVGSRVLVQRTGRPEMRRLRMLVSDLAWLRKQGRDVVLVSSGAIGAGMEALGLKQRPETLPDLQMAAAVGQNRLMARYDRLFSARGCRIGQVLLTHDDLKNRIRHLNARHAMMNMLRHGIIPVVNENDVVAVDEIKVGDNDELAALVALLIGADLLVMLTAVDGLRSPGKNGRTRRVPLVEALTSAVMDQVGAKGSMLSVGGMATKLLAAQSAARAGIPTVIASGLKPGVLRALAAGKEVGTLVLPPVTGARASGGGRRRWLAFFHRAAGTLIVDDGAVDALEHQGRSLLPVGIRDIKGDFPAGSVVNVRSSSGRLVARGLTDYASEQIRLIRGKQTAAIERLLGAKPYDEVMHRDNMVLMRTREGEIA